MLWGRGGWGHVQLALLPSLWWPPHVGGGHGHGGSLAPVGGGRTSSEGVGLGLASPSPTFTNHPCLGRVIPGPHMSIIKISSSFCALLRKGISSARAECTVECTDSNTDACAKKWFDKNPFASPTVCISFICTATPSHFPSMPCCYGHTQRDLSLQCHWLFSKS